MEDLPDFTFFVHFEKYIVCNVGGLRSPSFESNEVDGGGGGGGGSYWIHLVRLSVFLSVCPSVCRRHGFQGITQICFGISIYAYCLWPWAGAYRFSAM